MLFTFDTVVQHSTEGDLGQFFLHFLFPFACSLLTFFRKFFLSELIFYIINIKRKMKQQKVLKVEKPREKGKTEFVSPLGFLLFGLLSAITGG